MISNIISLFRVHQYIKNLFIFAPLLFSFSFEKSIFIGILFTFILFSLIASSNYIFNDLMDIKEDQKHPVKSLRAIASGKISKKLAIFLMICLSVTSLLSSYLISIELFLILLIYFLLNIAYSIKLKHIAIIDISIIATGFVLRLFAGNTLLNAPLSEWIIIITFVLALFLAIAKRRDDIILSLQGKKIRKNIDGYNLEFINAIMVLMAGVIIVSYILYTISLQTTTRLHTSYLYITSMFVIIGIIRYMQLTFVEEKSGSPTNIVLKDKFLKVVILLWLISFVTIVKGALIG